MKLHRRIIACEMISQYNLQQQESIKNLMNLIYKRIRIEGFSAYDYHHLFRKLMEFVLPLIREGKIVYVGDIPEGLEMLENK
ncbi:hypothetical protein L6164_002718 [Bauhinia variegata]|uniref:Uncharacterized protein n=1 Tax=Bauhinia variegata TaxID=167791 RepID=A0ACB9Q1R5_BAUVA|nr:hypothetical protein L6164_002718 [Bauhinia variegata]